ncbi:MAG: DUF3737 family protein [Ruminococcaceae bacterium]|nr:DUF3737 family protein [Oscillospiraceae bacterium]
MTVSNKTMDEERALYGLRDAVVRDCTFAGPADGESALKESRNVTVSGCTFELRYPLWHSEGFRLADSRMTDTCRAPLWYCKNGTIEGVRCTGVKALRECDGVKIADSSFISAEFGWKCRDISAASTHFESEYIFLDSKNITLDEITLKGKYSFQYTENLTIRRSKLDTKDSFWHAKDVLVEDSEVRGEYLGWYSDGLTMKNCRIIGTQPFCYCKNLRLIDCELVDCDLAFEYSDVEAKLRGHVMSVKNPRSGSITADSIGEIIRGGEVMECRAEVVVRKE